MADQLTEKRTVYTIINILSAEWQNNIISFRRIRFIIRNFELAWKKYISVTAATKFVSVLSSCKITR